MRSYSTRSRKREAELQRRLRLTLRGWGIETRKLASDRRGIPDLLVLLAGRHEFVEVKAEGGKLSKLQERTHAELRAAGCVVHVLYGFDGIAVYLASTRS